MRILVLDPGLESVRRRIPIGAKKQYKKILTSAWSIVSILSLETAYAFVILELKPRNPDIVSG